MSKTNSVRLIGHLGQDPQKVQATGGVTLARFSMSTQERFTDQSGQKREETEWHNVVAFGKIAELITSHLRKGAHVAVDGRIKTRKYETKEGETRYATEVICEEVLFLGKPKSN